MMRLTALTTIVFMALTAACTHAPQPAAPAVVEVVEPVDEDVPALIEALELPPTPRDRAQRAIQLLADGDEAKALVEIDAMLAADPASATARKLRMQIETDPKVLLGESHVPYSVKPGDTTSSLARTYLGDALLFYALARYNELEAANRLSAGQSLRMPDKYATPLAAAPQESAKAVEEVAELATMVEDAAPVDPAAANTLRLQALEQLNAGNSDRAMTLLERARRLDTNNPNIAADLAKVERIRAALSQSN